MDKWTSSDAARFYESVRSLRRRQRLRAWGEVLLLGFCALLVVTGIVLVLSWGGK